MPKITGSGKAVKGSRSPAYGYLYVLLLMFLMIGMAMIMSGGMIPVDPNGPGGPPTLPPYYGQDGLVDQQQIVLPSGALTPDPKGDLQLKTFKVNVCAQKTVFNFLVDTSGSMAEDQKIQKLKNALTAFTSKLSNTSGIGLQTFSDTVQERVPLDYYVRQKTLVQSTIADLQPKGWTRTRDGFTMAENDITTSIAQKQFPEYSGCSRVNSSVVPSSNVNLYK